MRDFFVATALQRFQISDQIVLLCVAEHVLVGRHAASALIDAGSHGSVRRFLAVGHLVFFEEAFEPGAHFLLVAVRVVAYSALLEHGLALCGIAFVSGKHYTGTRSQAHTQRKYTKSMHSQKILQRST